MFRKPRQSDLQTRLILCISCIAVGLSNSYLPLPTCAVKDRSVAFPCQNSVCGCRNAAQCWSNCRCNTDLQKLAWAEKNSVTPPDSFLRRMAAKKSALVDSKRQLATCVTAKGQTKCSCGKSKANSVDQDGAHLCCQAKCCHEHAKQSPQAKEDSKPPVIIQALRRCQGIAGSFFVVGVKLLPPQESAAAVLSQGERVCSLAMPMVLAPSQSPEPTPD